MTDFEVEANKFFSDEATHQKSELDTALLHEQLQSVIFSALQSEDAQPVWHPSKPERHAQMDEYRANLLRTDSRLLEDEANALTIARVQTEIITVSMIEMIIASRDFDLSAGDEAVQKRQLQAAAMALELNDGWNKTIGKLLHGPDLDLNKDEDAALYARVSFELLLEGSSTVAAINEIYAKNYQQYDISWQIQAIPVLHLVLRASHDKSALPELESVLDQHVREGYLSQSERELLFKLAQ